MARGIAFLQCACRTCSKRGIKAALENLRQAIDLDAGFWNLAKTNVDLDNIRQDIDFQTLIGQ
jgi:hypothetical protein